MTEIVVPFLHRFIHYYVPPTLPTKLLITTESWYSLSHFIVLFQLTNIMPTTMRGNISKTYFTGDLLSSLLSYYITRKNKMLVMLHALIHLPVVAHLFNIIPTLFYKNVFKIAYNNLNNVPKHHYYIYNIGTVLDLCCHLYNIKFLYQSLYKKNKD
tara:strand:+ start:669 stop:1136 length:468 start_codon:yes stop_codon:yes gene_type:complete